MRRFAIFSLILLCCLPAMGQTISEPMPEGYFPSDLEIRERAPAGVTDEWWALISRTLIWHVTPEFTTIPNPSLHQPWEIIRSATSGFLIRNATIAQWDAWPPVAGIEIFSSTSLISATSTINILNATTIITPGIISASSVVAPKTEWFFDGNNSYDIITLPTPAIDGTLEVAAITDPVISHVVEWIENTTNYAGRREPHWEAVKNPPIAGKSYYMIAGASPIEKWWPHTLYRFRFYEASQ
jgi:hypothetical protein